MTPEDIDLVQSSFAKVVPIREAAASLFYDRLFEIAPEVKPMFKGDMKEQGRKLMTTLGVVVNGLKDLEAIIRPPKRSPSSTMPMASSPTIIRCWGGIDLDSRKGPWRRLHASGAIGMDHSLYHALRRHDRRELSQH